MQRGSDLVVFLLAMAAAGAVYFMLTAQTFMALRVAALLAYLGWALFYLTSPAVAHARRRRRLLKQHHARCVCRGVGSVWLTDCGEWAICPVCKGQSLFPPDFRIDHPANLERKS
jgi:hypothetical protein